MTDVYAVHYVDGRIALVGERRALALARQWRRQNAGRLPRTIVEIAAVEIGGAA